MWDVRPGSHCETKEFVKGSGDEGMDVLKWEGMLWGTRTLKWHGE